MPAQAGPLPAGHDPLRGVPFPGSLASAVQLDFEGRIRDATPSAAALLGFDPEQIRGRTLSDLAAEGWESAAEVAAALVRFGSIESFELALRGRSGRRTLVEMSAMQFSGEPVQALVAWSERRGRRAPVTHPDSSNDLRRFAYGLLCSQESERMRVATRLQDELAPVLEMVRFQLQDALARLASPGAAALAATMDEACARLRDAHEELQRVASDLRPRILDELGLLPAVEWLCRAVDESRRDIAVTSNIDVREEDVPVGLRLDIFRVLQEALANAVSHAYANAIRVSLYLAEGELCALVEDDGKGFDPMLCIDPASASRGLHQLRRRVEASGGRMLIAPAKPHGTRIGAAWRSAPQTPAA